VTSGGALSQRLSDADILAFAGGVAASGSTAVQVTLAGNVVTNTTRRSSRTRVRAARSSTPVALSPFRQGQLHH
jgi:hypothetical protein